MTKNVCIYVARQWIINYICSMWKEKLGNYFLTGVFVASLVKDLEEIRWLIYVLSGSVAAVLLLLGLILTNKKEDK